jgi:nitrous oxidase accessory protein NosD
MRARTVLIASVLAAAAFAVQGSVLRWAPKEGDELRYQTIGKLDVNGIQAEITTTNVQKVLRVDSNGDILVEAKPIEGKAVYNGTELPVHGMTTQTKYGPNGEVKEIVGDRANATGYRMANLTNFHAPSKAVAVGDSWSADGKGDVKTGAVAWKVDYKVVAEETIGPNETLKMDVSARETEGTDGGKATGNIWVAKNGVLVRTDLKWTNMAVPGAPGPVNGSLTMNLLP